MNSLPDYPLSNPSATCDNEHMLLPTVAVVGGREGGGVVRPPFSFVALITLAILHSPHKCLTHLGICLFIKNKFSYYKEKFPALQRSIRKNLNQNDCFLKVSQGPGKEIFWMLDPLAANMFDNGSTLRRRKQYKRSQILVSGAFPMLNPFTMISQTGMPTYPFPPFPFPDGYLPFLHHLPPPPLIRHSYMNDSSSPLASQLPRSRLTPYAGEKNIVWINTDWKI